MENNFVFSSEVTSNTAVEWKIFDVDILTLGIKLDDIHKITLEIDLETSRKLKQPVFVITLFENENIISETRFTKIESLEIKKRHTHFRRALIEILKKQGFREFMKFLRNEVIPKLLDEYKEFIERKRREKEEKLKQLEAELKPELEKLYENPLKYMLDVLEHLHVGDVQAKQILLLAIASRLNLERRDRLRCSIIGPPSAGKSHLVESILKIIPRTWVKRITRLTAHALDYLEENIDGKILYIAELAGIKDEDATYSMRIMLSENELIILTVEKDPKTGKIITVEKRKKGAPILITTTTEIEIEDQLASRLVFISNDTSAEQTCKVMQYQLERSTLNNFERNEELERKIKACKVFWQRLEKYYVVIDDNLKLELEKLINDFPLTLQARREFGNLLAFIKAHALLNQFKRKREDDRRVLYATVEDLHAINEIVELLKLQAKGVKKKEMELFEILVYEMYAKKRDFITSREAAEIWKISTKQARRYLERLVKIGLLYVDTDTRPYRYYLTNEGKLEAAKLGVDLLEQTSLLG